jgi:hypothetical protein
MRSNAGGGEAGTRDFPVLCSLQIEKKKEKKKKEAPGENALEVFLSCVLLCK